MWLIRFMHGGHRITTDTFWWFGGSALPVCDTSLLCSDLGQKMCTKRNRKIKINVRFKQKAFSTYHRVHGAHLPLSGETSGWAGLPVPSTLTRHRSRRRELNAHSLWQSRKTPVKKTKQQFIRCSKCANWPQWLSFVVYPLGLLM